MTESPSNLLFSLRVPAQADRLRLIRASARDALAALGCSPEWTRDMLIAIDEACQNVVRHAYRDRSTGDMVVDARIEGNNLVILLRDFAPRIDPATVKPRDLDDIRPGGLGTHFIREVTDLCGFLEPPAEGGNLFRMVKALEHPPPCPASGAPVMDRPWGGEGKTEEGRTNDRLADASVVGGTLRKEDRE